MDTKILQQRVRDFVDFKNMETSIETRLLDLSSEVGELCKVVLKGNQYGKSNLILGKDFEDELGDVLFSIICIANTAGIDLNVAMDKTLEKYVNRIRDKGDAGSGR